MRNLSFGSTENASVQRTIVQAIRQRIISGEWPAGSQLPTRSELARLFDTSPSTVQWAMRGLVTEGSVVTHKRAGAFVAAEPPELCRFALVMSDHEPQAAGGSTLFLDQLIQAAQQVAVVHPGWRMDAWTAGDPQLEDLIASGALAGILYFGPAAKIPAAIAGAGLPLALFRQPEDTPPGVLGISIDKHNLFNISLRSHLARNRTRIAVLETGAMLSNKPVPLTRPVRQLVTAIRRAGGKSQPSWIQYVDPLNARAVHQTTLLVLDGRAAVRPEALILMDDHLLPPVLAAVRSLGLRVPRDVTISVLAFAGSKPRPDGCIRIGYKVEELVLEVLRRLSLRRQGLAASSSLRMALTER